VTTEAFAKTCRTMLVDDQQAFLDLARSLLAGQPGIEIVGEAMSGEEAVALLQTLKPEAVIVDVQMPGINGFETTRRLMKNAPDLRVIIMSAYEDPEYGALARTVGARGFFSKRTFPVEQVANALQGC
jgi:DNA-binding NarL/FixJ family response regulator